MTIKEGDRLADVHRIDGEIHSAVIFTVKRIFDGMGLLDIGESFNLSDPCLWGNKLEPVTDEIEAANDRRIENQKAERYLLSEFSRLRNLISMLDRTCCKDLSPEAVTRIADAIEKELT